MKEVKNNLTATETQAAIDMQRPLRSEQGEDKPVLRSNTFAQLAKVSRNARLTFGGGGQWIQPKDLFNERYRDGLESVPFFVTNAWQFTSKQGYGERLGLEIAMSNGRIYNVALGLSEGDIKRNDMIALFAEKGAPPIGPFCFHMLPLDRGNDYYDIVPYENVTNTTEQVEIPFAEINSDIPF